MKLAEINSQLKESHLAFTNYLSDLSKADYEFSYEEKWNAGQHLDHILIGVSLLAKAMKLPKWLLKYKFGMANRPSRTYDELVSKYNEKLKNAPPAPERFQPKDGAVDQREQTIGKLKKSVENLCKYSKKYSEANLDLYIIPHPLLGYLTVREMLYFTDYHVNHHDKLVKKYIALKN